MLKCFSHVFQLFPIKSVSLSHIYSLLPILHFYLFSAFILFAHNLKITHAKDLYELKIYLSIDP